MKGKVLDFSVSDSRGLITADDGNRYTFGGKDWKAPTHPQAGVRVDFEIAGGTAIGVYVDSAVKAIGGVIGDTDLSSDSRYSSIYCSQDEKMIFGLCGGLAHKYKLPPAAVRFATFALLLCFGVGLLYIVGAFLPKLPTKGIPSPG